MTTRRSRAFQFCYSIPILRPLVFVVNGYAWDGDSRSLLRFAPLAEYNKKIISKVLVSVTLAAAYVLAGEWNKFLRVEKIDSINAALQIFPNILGFGIGVYALIFAFPERFFKHLAKRDRVPGNKNPIGALGLNAMIAYPLCAIAIIILLALFARALLIPPIIIEVFGLSALLYGLWLTIELIALLYMSARKVIRSTEERALPPSRKALTRNSKRRGN